MTLPKAAGSHHTVWVRESTRGPHAVRYSVEGDRLVCFGDHELAAVPDGAHVTAAIHDIAGGSLLAEFGATVRTVKPEDVEASTVYELLEHVSLGRTPDEIEASFRAHRRRRLVELVA